MTMKFRTVLVTVALFCLAIVLGYEDRICPPHDLRHPVCTANETCFPNGTNIGICACKKGYIRNKTNPAECELSSTTVLPSPISTTTMLPAQAEIVRESSVSTGAITAAVLVPLMLVTGGILILVGRRYHWFERLQLLQGRRYEEVRIGQEDDEDDDPPLA